LLDQGLAEVAPSKAISKGLILTRAGSSAAASHTRHTGDINRKLHNEKDGEKSDKRR